MKLDLASSNRKEQPSKEGESIRHRVSSSRSLGYVFFLVLSFLLWYIQSLDREITRSIYIPLAIDSLNLPEAEGSDLPSHIEISVSDKLVNHILLSFSNSSPISLTLHEAKHASPYIGIKRTELEEQIKKRLSATAKLLSISPEEVHLPFHKHVSKLLPIKLSKRPRIVQGSIDHQISFSPDSVMVYASANIMNGLTEIKVDEFPKGDIRSSQTFTLPILYPKGVMGKYRTATVSVQVEELTEQRIEHLPIQVRNAPEDIRMILLPSTASLRLTILRKLNENWSEHLKLYVDYNDLKNKSDSSSEPAVEHKLPLHIENLSNHDIYSYTIEPSSIQYIQEKR